MLASCEPLSALSNDLPKSNPTELQFLHTDRRVQSAEAAPVCDLGADFASDSFQNHTVVRPAWLYG